MRKFTKRSVALVTAGVVAVSGGAAYAAWLISGGGSSSASASTSQGLTLADLGPAGTSGDVTVDPAFFPGSTNAVAFTVVNPNPFPVRITGVTLTVGDSTTNAACEAENVTVNDADLPAGPADLIVPAKTGAVNGTKAITYAGALSMIDDPNAACDGAAFPITVALAANSGTAPAA